MTLQEKLGKAIIQLRKQHGLAQEQFANEAEIDRRYMSDIENGKRNISIDVIERLANCLGINVSELFSIAENIDSARTLDEIKEWLCDRDYEDTVVLENPDYLSAIVGVSDDGRLIYDYEKMAEHLMATDGMDYEEACEFIDFNTIGALPYMGEKRPVIMYRMEG
ncbi:MAG: helix-turn-helix transcriptional regulator [Paludibacteraceae bacterium]|nr:helix-turn-helix transcriptional regulator [Paludibacteraceae bacterium]